MRIGDPLSSRNTSSTASATVPAEQETARPADFKKGDVLEGKVIAKDAEGISTVKTAEGKEVRIKVTGPEEGTALGKNVKIQLEDVSLAVKTGKLMTAGSAEAPLDSSIDSILKSFAESTGELQRTVVKAMVQFDVPLNKENFKAIQNDGKYAQKLGDMLSASPELASSVDIKAEVKNILVKLLSAGSTQPSSSIQTAETPLSQVATDADPTFVSDKSNAPRGSTTDAVKPVTVEGHKGGGISEPDLANLPDLQTNDPKKGAGALGQTRLNQEGTLNLGQTLLADDALTTDQVKTGIPSEAVSSSAALQKSPQMDSGKVGVENTAEVVAENLNKTQLFEADGKAVKSEIIQSLKEHSADKTAFFKKMAIDSTLSNIVTFNRLLINKQSMIGAFEKILSGMQDLGMTQDSDVRQLLMKLSNLDQRDLDGHIQILSQLSDKVTELKSSHSNQLDRIGDQLTQLRSDFDFIKTINDSVVYYQMPMHYEEGTGQLEVAYKKQKKDPSEGHKIFISLDTKNMGQVQAMVEMKGKTIKINFRVQDDALKQRFEEQFEALKGAVSSVVNTEDKSSNYEIELGFIVRQSPLSAMDLFRDEMPSLSTFDISI